MTGPMPRLVASLTIMACLVAGCGGGAAHTTLTGSSTSISTPAQPMIHANPVTLLPTGGQVAGLIRPSATPNRYDETLSRSTLSSAFVSEVARARALASGTAELDVAGRNGTFLYVHVFLFKTVAGASSLAATFLSSTRLRTASARPAAAPGQQGESSSQSYGHRQASYRYAFRQDNVLAYVELDGPRHRYTPANGEQLAELVAQHIHAAAP